MTDYPKTTRELTDTEAFHTARRVLRHSRIVQTRPFLDIITEVSKVHEQYGDVADPELPRSRDNRPPADGLLIIGDPGTGKTFAVEQAIKILPDVRLPDGTKLSPKSISVRAPAVATMPALATEIVNRVTGLEMSRTLRDEDAERKVRGHVGRGQFSMLFIDDLSNTLDPNEHARHRLVVEAGKTFKLLNLMLDAGTPIVATGSEDMLKAFETPDKDSDRLQIRRSVQRRMSIYRVPPLTIEEDGSILEAIVEDYCSVLGVRNSLSSDDEIGGRLIHASNRAMGNALRLAQRAVALAHVRPRGKLKRDDFADVYEFKSGCASSANIFLAADWPQIDTAVIAARSFEEGRNLRGDDREWD